MAIVACKNCGSKIRTKRFKNRWVEWFSGYCETCGWNFKIKDIEFDLVQPSNPLFKEIYGYSPENRTLKEQKQKLLEKEKFREEREERLYRKRKEGKLKSWDIKNIKSYVKSRGLE